MEAHGVTFAGWVANALDPEFARPAENLAALERLLGAPALASVPYLERPDRPISLDEGATRLLAAHLKPMIRLE
jgi:dethiobiotin synthetase